MTSAIEMQNSINRLLADIGLLNDIVNGDVNTDVVTQGGVVPSIAKLQSLFVGWSPSIALVPDGSRMVMQVVDWIGGNPSHSKPALTGYIGSTGLVSDISSAVNVRGPSGTGGGSTSVFVGLFVDIPSVSIPDGIDMVITSGYSVTGKGSAKYKVGTQGVSAPQTRYSTNSANNKPVYIYEDEELTVTQFGALGDGVSADYEAIQMAVNYSTVRNKSLRVPAGTYFNGPNRINFPMLWKNFRLIGDGPGSPDPGLADSKITQFVFSSGGGIDMRYTESYHETIRIQGLLLVNSGQKLDSHVGLRVVLDGSRTTTNNRYHYVNGIYFDNLSFYNWGEDFEWLRDGGVLDPAGYIGLTRVTNIHSLGSTYHVVNRGCYQNLYSAENCRIHVCKHVYRIVNGGGYYVNKSLHHEGGLSRTLIEDSIYETSFVWDSCGSEAVGDLVDGAYYNGLQRYAGADTFRAVNHLFMGHTILPGSFEAPPRCDNKVVISNMSNNNITVEGDGCVIMTPHSINVAPPKKNVVQDRVRYYDVPWSAYGGIGTKRNSVALPIAGWRTFGDPAIGMSNQNNSDYILSSNSQFSTNQPIPRTLDSPSGETMFVLSFVGEFTKASTRFTNPLDIGLEGGRYFYASGPFWGESGTYCRVMMIRNDTGENIDTLEVSMVNMLNGSVGYGDWQTATVKTAVDICHPKGRSLKSIRAVPAMSTVSIPFRGKANDNFNAKVTVRAVPSQEIPFPQQNLGVCFGEYLVMGRLSSNAGDKMIETIIQRNIGSGSISVGGGSINDFFEVSMSNTGDKQFTLTTELNV